MLIGITSDTHDNGRPTLRSIDFFNEHNISLLLHCGDWDMPFVLQWYKDLCCPMKGVLGNGDADIHKFKKVFSDLKLTFDFEIETHILDLQIDNQRIAVVHGDSENLVEFILESQLFDVLCRGHNHVADISQIGRTLVINPGTLVGVHMPESRQHPYTVATYDTRKRQAQIHELSVHE